MPCFPFGKRKAKGGQEGGGGEAAEAAEAAPPEESQAEKNAKDIAIADAKLKVCMQEHAIAI